MRTVVDMSRYLSNYFKCLCTFVLIESKDNFMLVATSHRLTVLPKYFRPVSISINIIGFKKLWSM